MKYFVLAIVALLFITVSCKKEEGASSMSAKIDGVSWSTITRVTRHQGTNFIITGTSATGTVIAVTVRGDEQKTYSFSASMDSVSAQCVAVYQPSITSPSEDNYFSRSGSVTLSEVDTENKKISGTFEFTVMNLEDAKEITAGKFENLTYTE